MAARGRKSLLPSPDMQLTEKERGKAPYFKYAIHNVYNYTLLGGVAAAAAATGNWWLAVAGGGAEILWMLFGPDSRFLRRAVFDKVHAQRLRELAEAERDRLLAGLPSEDLARVASVERRRSDLLKLCAENERFGTDLLGDELKKIDQLTLSMVDLVVSARRYKRYLETADIEGLEADLRRHRAIVEQSKDPERRELSRKNLAVLEMRRDKLSEIKQLVLQAHGQMDLIENTFRLLADQIVTMRSPTELGSQLDELMDGVEAVKSTAREAQKIMEST